MSIHYLLLVTNISCLLVVYSATFATTETLDITNNSARSDSGTSYNRGIGGYGELSSQGCIDDNSGKGCCSNGLDFPGCLTGCNGDNRCENWCRSNCWNYWSIGFGNVDRDRNGGSYPPSPLYPSHSAGRDPEWPNRLPCSSGYRVGLDLGLALAVVFGLVWLFRV